MRVLAASCTDAGTKRKINQDSFCIKAADTPYGEIVMAAVCDGMGGLLKGEVASASVVNAFSKWFEAELPSQIAKKDIHAIQYRWNQIIQEQNRKIAAYGRERNIQLGTTLTVLLLLEERFFIIGHVGDSRAYVIHDKIEIMTEDQAIVGREVKRGIMTAQQAEADPRRNMLLQCIGASKVLVPQFVAGRPVPDAVYMLCTDGFRHVLTENEILEAFSPCVLKTEMIMEQKAKELVARNKHRGETDDITVLLMKMQAGGNEI
ncbi:PP2C family protein-serine/threonine phosphatase [Caproiciproducens galactitolivorans]|uniref:Protein phosphatase 2C domain-containing protein n=1 Tax=Caproiciproducens galactitolivorans TaxID=642589 RepID=A0ABT4BT59_9FIRM|nr:protein phosphatase 2C domain-containing protein [Caproiciproducens galactitolivorans]MCY1713970.1 protein phosphatase 2C domain-containing protein [Caproiciproducens galactitolivorans]